MKKLSDTIKGNIVNIQRYSLHDGEGIRTVVFFKGCNLRCSWCSNPESLKKEPEIYFDDKKCIGIVECGSCLKACKNGALHTNNKLIQINRQICINCLLCVNECPSKAIGVYGKSVTIDEVLDVIQKDEFFYSRSGGGVTLSGGEILLQPEFASELLKRIKKLRINTAIETSGYGNFEKLKSIAKYADIIYFDIKSLDNQKHYEYTGVSNNLILENLKQLYKLVGKKIIIIRTPIVPGFNDSEKELRNIINFLDSIGKFQYELLKYHRYGSIKYEKLGIKFKFEKLELDNYKFENLKKILTEEQK